MDNYYLMKKLYVIFILVSFLTSINSCGNSPASQTTKVTINLGETKTASYSDKLLRISSIPSDVVSIRFTILVPNMMTIERTVSTEGKTTISESFEVPNGDDRYFLVEALDVSYNILYRGHTSTDLNGMPVTLDILIASTIPTDVQANPGNEQVTISWSEVSEATSYNIYWATTAGVTKTNGTKITNVTSPYIHTGLTNGTTYYYVVTTVYDTGESAESAEVSATPFNLPPPPP